MSNSAVPDRESPRVQFRRLVIPDRLWQFVWLRRLPEYFRSIPWNDCPRPRWRVALDLLYIFFKLKVVPEHYGPCRLWEVPRKDWALYYGSPYTPLSRGRIAKRVYPYEYETLYNDKVVGAQLAKSLEIRQPRLFGMLEPDQAWRERLTRLFQACDHDKLMLKPVYGRGGAGIVVAERDPQTGGITIRTRSGAVALADFTLDWCVFVQEVIRQDPRIGAIWNSSVNTVRVVTLLRPDGDVVIVGCGMRFGVGDSYVDNWSAGGISAGVDKHTGRLRKVGFDRFGNRYTQHPGSGFVFDGFEFPNWQRVIEAAKDVQRALPFSRISGLDICLDEHGEPTLIEINGLPDLVPKEQLNGPLLADEQVLRAFAEYDLLVSPAQRALLRNLHPVPATEHTDDAFTSSPASPAPAPARRDRWRQPQPNVQPR